jgi:hypothetical protein
MNYLEKLRDLIAKEFSCKVTHLESVPIFEQPDASRYWKGVVEVFALDGYPAAPKCYAWHLAEGKDIRDERFVAVRHIPPNDSPLRAVQAVLAADLKARLERAAKDAFGEDVTIGPIQSTTMGDLKNEHVQRVRRLFGIQDNEDEKNEE